MTADAAADVLIVEDETAVAELYSSWLDDRYSVTIATSGERALEVFDADVDVVVLDRRMPEISGDEVLAELRERGCRCPIAVVTAVDPDVDIVEMDCDEYLVKPVSEAELCDVIERLLARTKYTDQLREYFAAVSKREVLHDYYQRSQLEDDDAFRRLEARIEALESDLDTTLAQFEDRDFEAVFRDFDP